MKKYSLLAFLLVAVSLNSFAQSGRFAEKKQQIKTLKIAFITEKLNLTSAEAEKFWPLYNAFDEKQHELKKQKMQAVRKNDESAISKMSDKDATAFLSQMENSEEELHQLRKKFTANLKTVLPATKIIQLKKAEEDFNRKLLKQYKEKGRKR